MSNTAVSMAMIRGYDSPSNNMRWYGTPVVGRKPTKAEQIIFDIDEEGHPLHLVKEHQPTVEEIIFETLGGI